MAHQSFKKEPDINWRWQAFRFSFREIKHDKIDCVLGMCVPYSAHALDCKYVKEAVGVICVVDVIHCNLVGSET